MEGFILSLRDEIAKVEKTGAGDPQFVGSWENDGGL